MERPSGKKRLIGRRKAGFTLIELLMVVAIIGILAAIALPVYANIQAKARVGKAQVDIRTIASAIVAYQAHCGVLPPVGDNDTDCNSGVTPADGSGEAPGALAKEQINLQNQKAGAFIAASPKVPASWTGAALNGSYRYTISNSGTTFVVCATGDNTGASTDGTVNCQAPAA